MSAPQPHKRPAFESASRLIQPIPLDPRMPRPAATVAGALLVMLRVLAGILWLFDFIVNWPRYAGGLFLELEDIELTASQLDEIAFGIVVSVVTLMLLVDAVLAVLILRGVNWARVVVMIVSVLSISTAFAAWWSERMEITLTSQTSLVTVAFDILVLLALSSRSAAAYARRNERR